MKKICIALDTSSSAEKIAAIGYEYGKALNAEVILIHVIYDSSIYVSDFDPAMDYAGFMVKNNAEFTKSIFEQAESFLEAIAKYLGEPDLETKVLEGDAYDEILNFADRWEADLLVLGTHSQSSWEDLLLGNIASKIVKHSKIQLLVVPIKD